MSKHLLIKVLAISGNSKYFHFFLQKIVFGELGVHAKFHDPTKIRSGRIVTAGKEEENEQK